MGPVPGSVDQRLLLGAACGAILRALAAALRFKEQAHKSDKRKASGAGAAYAVFLQRHGIVRPSSRVESLSEGSPLCLISISCSLRTSSMIGENNKFRPGEYHFDVVVRADDAKAFDCRLKLKWILLNQPSPARSSI